MNNNQASSSVWLVSRNQDLVWIQGSVLAGVALMLVFLALPKLGHDNYTALNPAVLLLLFWGIIFDGSHVMATYARTYFADDEHSKAALPGNISFVWLLVGPAFAIADYLFFKPQPSIVGQAGLLFGIFLAAAYLWAYYHLIRQHYGFLSLYRRKSGQTTSIKTPDALFLWAGTAYPFLRFNLSEAYKSCGLPVLLPDASLAPLRALLDVSMLTVLAIAAVWLCRMLMRKQRLEPKHLFLVIVVGFSNLVFALLDNLLVITAVLTIFHNLQYHRIVWQYERGQGRIPMRSIARYAAAGLGFGLVWYGPRVLGVAVAENNLWCNVLIGLGWSVAFHHYFIDARIWRVRRQPGVEQALNRGAA